MTKTTEKQDTELDNKQNTVDAKVNFNKKKPKELTLLREQLKLAHEMSEEMKKTTQFVQAEFENYKKRQDRDYSDKIEMSTYDIISKLLPVLDDFEHSIANLKNSSQDSENNESVLSGFQMIFDNFFNVLKKEGLEEVNPEGEKFDPYLHEALMQEKSDKEAMTILQVLQKGYKLKGKIVRHAKVKVAQSKKE